MRRKVQVRFCEGESGDQAMDDRSLLYGLEDESRRQLIPRGGDMILLKGVVIVPTLETKRLQLIPFTLDLKEAAMNDRARLV